MNYNKLFNISFEKLALLLTPVFWRKITFVDWLYCLIEPVRILFGEFLTFRKKAIYDIVHTGQVILLEKVLNDAYDPNERRIYITDSLQYDPTYIYRQIEEKLVYLNNPVYLYTFDSFKAADVDFLVIFPKEIKPVSPIELSNLENRAKAKINSYKLASKTYAIKWTF